LRSPALAKCSPFLAPPKLLQGSSKSSYNPVVPFSNVYDDAGRAEAYATLEFPGTYYLAYLDLPAIIAQHVSGRNALDFGCGAGRSTRFLKKLGFKAIGIDFPFGPRTTSPNGVVTPATDCRFLLSAFGRVASDTAQPQNNPTPIVIKTAFFRLHIRFIAFMTFLCVDITADVVARYASLGFRFAEIGGYVRHDVM